MGTVASVAVLLSSLPGSAIEVVPFAPAGAGVSYTYDPLGRLKTVKDQAGAKATYTYDAVGNVTKIARSGVGATTTDAPDPIQPKAATPVVATASVSAPGQVMIGGTGFSAMPNEDVVRIGGLYAEVQAATPTQLTVTLPTGTTSELIEVTTPGGTSSITTTATLAPSTPFASAGAAAAADPPETLVAPLGVTAVSGLVLSSATGRPLRGVKLAIDARETLSDSTGRFLLTGIPAGHHELEIDGSRSAAGDFGKYEQGVDAVTGRTVALQGTTWLTPVDDTHGTTIPTTTDKQYTVTSPDIPGLEVIVPPGTSIVDEEGAPVHRLSITLIPIDRQPFVGAPGMTIAWTLQPGNAVVNGPGLAAVYPNLTHQPPGATVEYVDHDADRLGMGWAVYGHGTVTADGTQIAPDDDTRLHKIYQLGVNYNKLCKWLPFPFSEFCPADGEDSEDGDPVALATGLFLMSKTDLALPDVIPLAVTRSYRQNDPTIRSFGVGQSDGLNIFIAPDDQSDVHNYFLGMPDGSAITFTPGADGVYRALDTPTAFANATLTTTSIRDFIVTLRDGTAYTFGAHQASLIKITDRYGNSTTLDRDSEGYLRRATTENGRWITFDWAPCSSTQCIAAIHDNVGRAVTYAYDANARLISVTDPAGGVTRYEWEACADANASPCTRILSLKDPRNITYLSNHYDVNGRVDTQTQADGGVYQFSYTVGENAVASTLITDPRGFLRRIDYTDSYPSSDTYAVSRPEEQQTTYEYDADHRVVRMVDELGRVTTHEYDLNGNVVRTVRNAETPGASTETFTYGATLNRLTAAVNALGEATTFEYNDVEQSISMTDPLGNVTVTRLVDGQPASIRDPLGNTTYLSYLHGDSVAVADPLGRVTRTFYDSAGRPIRTTDAGDKYTSYTYDVVNQNTAIVDALNGRTKIEYDRNGNLTKIIDPRGNATAWTYDAMDRVSRDTDALGKTRAYVYDTTGNVTKITDRNGLSWDYTFDALSRPKTIVYSLGNKISYTYDRGNRLTRAVDSIGGTITTTYDAFDQPLSETTSAGRVTYTYDLAGRRTSMQAPSQLLVGYNYDDTSRLTSITQGTDVATFEYDGAGRPSSTTLPNGVSQTYRYDAAGQVTSVKYLDGATALGTLTYTYGKTGLRTTIGGSWARTLLPSAMGSATYDATNQVQQFGARAFTYDNEGQVLSDGTASFTWNPRHQLAGAADAIYGYDAYGRRTSRSVSGETAVYVYDGANAVQERYSGGNTAEMLTGLSLDEVFQRTDDAGARVLLRDALNSTTSLANSAGNVTTEYSYEPFGETAESRAGSENAVQFTGRENDENGIYYYRDRYFDPTTQRFLSRDPVGMLGGVNLYAYVNNSPTNYTDPTGDNPVVGCAVGAAASAVGGAAYNWLNHRKTTLSDIAKNVVGGCLAGIALVLGGPLLQAALARTAPTILASYTRAAPIFGRLSTEVGIRYLGWSAGVSIFTYNRWTKQQAGAASGALALAYLLHSGHYPTDDVGVLEQIQELLESIIFNSGGPWFLYS